MANVLVDESALSSIANAIREKNGTENTYKPAEMGPAISAIESGGSFKIPEISGNCNYRFANNGWNWVLEKNPKFGTLTNITYMFYNCTDLKNISIIEPISVSSTVTDASQLFSFNQKLENLSLKFIGITPIMCDSMFASCYQLKEIPDDLFTISSTSSYRTGILSSIFTNCRSLRKLPTWFLTLTNFVSVSSQYASWAYNLSYLRSLDEIVDITFPIYNRTSCTTNLFNPFNNLNRLKRFTFSSKTLPCTYTNQVIDLSITIGYAGSTSELDGLNNGITVDKRVTDDTSYQALKNDPDWWTTDIAYSRYNHDSAVETINSLPDVSAGGGTNTIKFKGAAGSATDGGAVSTLTPEEIAIATEKGWTVTLV